jgi:hypothetical protein
MSFTPSPLQRHPDEYFDTIEDGWEQAALQALLDGDDAPIYDYPTRRWIMLRASWFPYDRPVLPRMRRILRREFGVQARRQGRRK